MPDLSLYLPLNPFVDTSVGENHVWGEAPWLDVPEVHGEVFRALEEAIRLVRETEQTQVRFLRGAGGAGKSHLLARLRLQYADSLLYAYAANPPLHPEALEAFLLNRLLVGLRHRARNAEGVLADFTQLQRLAYSLLRLVVEQEFSVEDLHAAWKTMATKETRTLTGDAARILQEDHPGLPAGVISCLLATLLSDRRHLAVQWLAGGTYLTEEDLATLQVSGPLDRQDYGTVIQWFGKLARMAGIPLVLALDQLDLIKTPEQLDEFQRLIAGMIDQSVYWVILIGLTTERFRDWDLALNQALRSRIGILDTEGIAGYRLPVAEVSPLNAAEQEALLRRRLAAPRLADRRKLDSVPSTIFPFTTEDVRQLSQGGGISPRALLAASRDRYRLRLHSPSVPIPLAEAMQELLEEAIGQTPEDTPSAVELGERARDLFQMLSRDALTETEGPMRKAHLSFDGADRILTHRNLTLRLVSTHASARSLVAVLDRLLSSPGDALLLRYASIPISGAISNERLRQYKVRGNQFHTVDVHEWRTLAGLGLVLAALREGNYSTLNTVPPATTENVLQCLRVDERLTGLKLVHAARGLWRANLVQTKTAPHKKAPASTRTPVRVPAPRPSPHAPRFVPHGELSQPDQAAAPQKNGHGAIPQAPPPSPSPPADPPETESVAGFNTDRVQSVRQILESERWLEIGRLQRHLANRGIVESVDEVRHLLRAPEIAKSISLMPKDVKNGESGLQIILWNEA